MVQGAHLVLQLSLNLVFEYQKHESNFQHSLHQTQWSLLHCLCYIFVSKIWCVSSTPYFRCSPSVTMEDTPVITSLHGDTGLDTSWSHCKYPAIPAQQADKIQEIDKLALFLMWHSEHKKYLQSHQPVRSLPVHLRVLQGSSFVPHAEQDWDTEFDWLLGWMAQTCQFSAHQPCISLIPMMASSMQKGSPLGHHYKHQAWRNQPMKMIFFHVSQTSNKWDG